MTLAPNSALLADPRPIDPDWARVEGASVDGMVKVKVRGGEPARYFISDDLYATFSAEQVNKQMARLIETGRVEFPSQKYTVRLSDVSFDKVDDGPHVTEAGRPYELFADFEFGEMAELQKVTLVARFHYKGIPLAKKKACLDWYFAKDMAETGEPSEYWWEKDWLCKRLPISFWNETLDDWQWVARFARNVLLILLQDARTNKIEIEPRRPSKLHKLGIGKKREDEGEPNVPPEITLHIPKRIYTGEWGGTHASPRLHYRAEHTRQQAIGPRGDGQHKEIVIEGTWINAKDADPNELSARPTRSFKLTN